MGQWLRSRLVRGFVHDLHTTRLIAQQERILRYSVIGAGRRWRGGTRGSGEITPTSAARAAEHLHELGNLLALLIRVTARNRVLDAMRDVIVQDLLLDPGKGCPDRRDLRHDIDTVAIVLDHASEAADLAFYAAQAFQPCGFRFDVHR